MKNERIVVISPTFNAGNNWSQWIEAVKKQKGTEFKVLVIDSGSSDDTVPKAQQAGFEILEIPNFKFNHGGTRNLGVDHLREEVDFFVFLTQDAILSDPYSIKNILKDFENPKIGAVCGRQLPHNGAKPIEVHARLFNYPEQSRVRSKLDIKQLGIKTAFMSNSFAAYRGIAFDDVQGFPTDTIFAEDMSIAAKMILKGWKVSYNAEACVYHSHSYSLVAEFQRYFDVGVFYSRECWISEQFGEASGEGLKFVLSEIKYLLKSGSFYLVPEAILRTITKYIAFKLGRMERFLSKGLKRKWSMNKNYWQ